MTNLLANTKLHLEQLGNHNKPLLTITDSSIYCGLSIRSLNNLIYKRQIPVVHVGRRVYIRRSDLDQLIENGTQK